ncbi:unnamed protein product [Withania somnifera]
MLVKFNFRPLLDPKPIHFLRYFCSSHLHPTAALPQLQPSNDADLISQLLLQHHNPFHAMESSHQLYGIALTPFLVNQILLRLKHSSKIALSFFHYIHSHTPNCTSSSDDEDTSSWSRSCSFSILIDILCTVRQFDVAWQLIIQMEEQKVKITFTTFYLLIRRLIAAGFTRQAIRTFSEMHVFLDDEQNDDRVWKSYCCYLLDTLCKYGYVKVAVEVFNKEKWRLEVNSKIYTVLIYGWCKVKNIEMARRFLEEMLEKRIDPSVVTYNVLLNGICRRASLHPDGRFDKVIRDAEKVFDEMIERGVEPDVTSYSILLHVYSRAHKPELSLEKLRIMRRKGICPNIVTYTSVIKCLCSCGRLEDAELLLEQMVSNGFKGRKDVDGALRLYGKMKQGSLWSPSVSTFNILLGMLLKLGRIGLARDIWDDMKNSGVAPDLDSYTLLIHGFCEKQNWKPACEFFMEMIEKGFLPQKVTFETLYRGLIQSNMLRTWRRLKKGSMRNQ